ncbi:MAG: DUF2061 domain-containing protein [Ignavibacteria bacterium]
MPSLTRHSHKTSFLKSVSWRVIGTLDTILLSWLFTGQLSTALKIGGIELFTKIFLYYLHERIWISLKIGKTKVISEKGIVSYEDKHSRSFVKGISWRIVGTLDTIIIAFFVTGDYRKAFEIGFTEVFTKLILFYLHERLWMRITKTGIDQSDKKNSLETI